MPNDTFMANGPRNQSGKGSAFERRAWSAAISSGARRRSSPAGTRVRSLRASSLSLPRESIPAQSSGRSSRNHDTGHVEASPPNRGTSPQICKNQRSNRRRNRNHGVECLSAYAKKAWLSRIQEAPHFESISHIHLIAYSKRSSRRLTRFWSHVANALPACV